MRWSSELLGRSPVPACLPDPVAPLLLVTLLELLTQTCCTVDRRWQSCRTPDAGLAVVGINQSSVQQTVLLQEESARPGHRRG